MRETRDVDSFAPRLKRVLSRHQYARRELRPGDGQGRPRVRLGFAQVVEADEGRRELRKRKRCRRSLSEHRCELGGRNSMLD